MRIGSLFSGVGGLELGLERAGLGEVVWQVEREPYAQRVLAKHWPHATRYDDVTTVGAHNLAPVDVVCGGFPCQDLSYAGRGAGLGGARSGLWFEMLRIIEEVKPHVVIAENVAALRTRGLPVVVAGLRDAGYRVVVVPCSAGEVGAVHDRGRIFICATRVAYSDNQGLQSGRESSDQHGPSRRRDKRRLPSVLRVHRAHPTDRRSPAKGRGFEPRMGGVPDGLSGGLDGVGRFAAEVAARTQWPARPGQPQFAWEAPRVAKGVRDRSPRLKALGNAVAPPVAEAVGRWVMHWIEHEESRTA